MKLRCYTSLTLESHSTRSIERIHALWQQSQAGSARVLVLSAEAGMGKSWLLQRWRQSLPISQTQQVLEVQGPLLRGLLKAGWGWFKDVRSPAFVGAARQVWPEGPWPLMAESHAFETSEQINVAVFNTVQELAVRLGGLALLIEDATGLNPDELNMLELFWRKAQAGQTPVLFLVAARPALAQALMQTLERNTLEACGLQHWQLQPLPLEGTQTLTQEILHHPDLPEGLVEWLHNHTEGHPLYSTELLRHLIASRVLHYSHSWVFDLPTDFSLPQTLEAVLKSRLAAAQQDPLLWKALGALAVLEQTDLGGWAKVSQIGREKLLEAAHRALELGLVRSSMHTGQTLYTVAHPLYAPLVRRTLLENEQKNLHRRAVYVASGLSQRARHARLSEHPEAMHYTRLALEEAHKRHSYAEAAYEAENLLQFDPPDASMIQLQRVWDLFYGGQTETAWDEVQSLGGAEAAWAKHRLLVRLGRFAEAKSVIVPHLDDAAWGVELRFALCDIEVYLDNIETSEALARALLAQHPKPSVERARALYALGVALGSDAHPAKQKRQSLKYLGEAVATIRPFNKTQTLIAMLNLAGSKTGYVGEWEVGKARLEEALRLDAGMGSSWQGYMLTNLGFLLLQQGHYAEAKQTLLKALHIAEVRRDLRLSAAILGNLGVANKWLGQLEEAQHQLERSLELATDEAGSSTDLAEVLALSGHTEAALKRLEGPNPGNHFLMPYSKCRVLLLSGQPHQALEVLEQADASPYHAALQALHRYLHAVALQQTGYTATALEVLKTAQGLARSVGQSPLEHEICLAAALWQNESQSIDELQRQLQDTPGHLLMLRQLYPQGFQKNLQATPVHSRFICTLGQFELEQEGRVIPWKARKPRELLALLLAAYLREDGPGVGRETLVAALWPETEPGKAESNFRVTLGRLRESLGDAARIEHQNGKYALVEPKADVCLFLQAAHRLDLEGAVSWYAGAFLPEMDLEALAPLRAQLHERWRKAIFQLSRELEPTQLLPLFERLIAADPFDVEAIQTLADLLAQTAQEAKLRQLLHQSRQRFSQELGHVPEALLALRP